MTTNVIVSVTEVDIALGTAGDCRACPVHRALRRSLRPGLDFGVYRRFLNIVDVSRRAITEIDLPEEVVTFIDKFDDGGRIHAEPFTFSVDIPTEYVA